MSTIQDLTQQALIIRDSYRTLNETDGHLAWGVSDYTAGFVGDVGDLSKLVMAKSGLRRGADDIDDALAHELSDCLWSVLVIADELGINLEQSFTKNMNDLEARIEKEKVQA